MACDFQTRRIGNLPWLIGTFTLLTPWIVVAISLGNEPQLGPAWKQNAFATARFEINGTEDRNNPLRRPFAEPRHDEQLFVRYRIRYDAASIDLPDDDEGEFVVLWLDENEGTDASTHSGGVPNIGIHVSGIENRFMIRFNSGKEAYSKPLVGDQDFLVVARIWKSKPGKDLPFDQLDLWIDPKPDLENRPDASISHSKAISQIRWLGFSTGQKTEWEDRITVWDIGVAANWRSILSLPPTPEPTPTTPPNPIERTVDFRTHILPILRSRCFSCHQGDDADIRLDVHDEVLQFCRLHDSSDSPLYEMITQGEMPPEGETPLTEAEIKTIGTWIQEGLAWDDALLPPPVPQSNHWSFQPIRRPEIPSVGNPKWVQTPVDAFVLRKQESLGITPVGPADRETLARRLSLDLTGLPPNDFRVNAPVETNLRDAWQRYVDQLLHHPAHGVRWGRHWLDVARWAESNGHQHNRFRQHAWRYRDWVVDAFNQDLPFDQFLTAQIAGDEQTVGDLNDDQSLVATGFLAAARYSGNELDKRIQRNDILVDMTNTTCEAFLGLTAECAQCHTHKFDPFSLRDYYRFQAFFAKGQPVNLALGPTDSQSSKQVQERWQIFDQTYQRLVRIRQRKGIPQAELVIPKTVVKQISGSARKRFEFLEREIAKAPQTWGFYSALHTDSPRLVTPHDVRWPLPRDLNQLQHQRTRMLLRGDVNAPGPEVSPGWPLVFGRSEKISIQTIAEHPRTALATWMTDRKNPLTARVWVNRIWHWHFGRGLVETVGDFGTQGTEPSLPELLDFLAAELMDHDWSTHHIHRLIVHSATYQRANEPSDTNSSIDPENKWYWRWTPRRLEAEAIRDCMLAVSGQLDQTLGGPSIPDSNTSKRRSLYLRQHRERFPDYQELFDGARGITSCSRRRVSTNSLQPLWALNSSFSQDAAKALTQRHTSVSSMFRCCLGRQPSEGERSSLQQHADKHGLASVALVLMNTSEFVYIP